MQRTVRMIVQPSATTVYDSITRKLKTRFCDRAGDKEVGWLEIGNPFFSGRSNVLPPARIKILSTSCNKIIDNDDFLHGDLNKFSTRYWSLQEAKW